MDDGMQFAHEDQSNYPAGPDISKVIYKVGYTTYSGNSWKYIGNDQAEYETELAKMEAKNIEWEGKKGWKPRTRPFEIVTEIIEPVVEEQVSKDQISVEEQVVEAQASTGTIEGRDIMKNFPIRDEYDAEVRMLSRRFAEQLPNGYCLRLHQDHIPLQGVIIRWDADGKSQQRIIENPYAIAEAREFLQKLLNAQRAPLSLG